MHEIIGRYIEIDGIRSYFESVGSGVPILMLHTAGRDNRQWQNVMQRLGGKFRCIAPDLPGHGKSWPLEGNTCLNDIDAIADWIWKFSVALSLDRPAVMGCSIGGNLSLLLAARHSEIRCAIALQGAAHTPTFTDTALEMMTHPQVSLMHANLDFSMSLVGSASSAEGRAFSEWGVLSVIPLAQQNDLRAYTQCDTRQILSAVRCPVLLARGTEDWLVSQEMIETARDSLTSAASVELRPLPGLGHFPHIENPGLVAAMAEKFLHGVC